MQIKTELQIISDLVYVREVQFLRFCKKHAEGVWAIVDVSVDTIQEGSQQSEIENCRRLPSGCILQDMPNGYCQVIQNKLSFYFTFHRPLYFLKFNELDRSYFINFILVDLFLLIFFIIQSMYPL